MDSSFLNHSIANQRINCLEEKVKLLEMMANEESQMLAKIKEDVECIRANQHNVLGRLSRLETVEEMLQDFSQVAKRMGDQFQTGKDALPRASRVDVRSAQSSDNLDLINKELDGLSLAGSKKDGQVKEDDSIFSVAESKSSVGKLSELMPSQTNDSVDSVRSSMRQQSKPNSSLSDSNEDEQPIVEIPKSTGGVSSSTTVNDSKESGIPGAKHADQEKDNIFDNAPVSITLSSDTSSSEPSHQSIVFKEVTAFRVNMQEKRKDVVGVFDLEIGHVPRGFKLVFKVGDQAYYYYMKSGSPVVLTEDREESLCIQCFLFENMDDQSDLLILTFNTTGDNRKASSFLKKSA